MTTTTEAPAARLLSVPEVCDQLQVAPSTFYRWVRTGGGPRHIKLRNGALRFRQEWVDDYLLELEVSA